MMTMLDTYRLEPEEAARIVLPHGVILVETDEADTRYRRVRLAALRTARAAGARLVLYDRSSASLFTDPYPSGRWTADVDGPRGDRPLRDSELRQLGRSALRDQLAEAAGAGVQAEAWLARGVGASAVADAVVRSGAQLVLRLTDDKRPSLLQRLLGDSLAAACRELPVPVAAVDPDGRLTFACPSGAAAWPLQMHRTRVLAVAV
jgi:hypothetical protein